MGSNQIRRWSKSRGDENGAVMNDDGTQQTNGWSVIWGGTGILEIVKALPR